MRVTASVAKLLEGVYARSRAGGGFAVVQTSESSSEFRNVAPRIVSGRAAHRCDLTVIATIRGLILPL